MKPVAGRVPGLFTVFLLVMLFASGACAAQDDSAAADADAGSPRPGLYLRDENGQETYLGPRLPESGRLEKLLTAPADPPGVGQVSISSIHMTARQITDEHVDMDVTLTVVVPESQTPEADSGKQWHRIPIRFPGWQIRRFQESPATGGRSRFVGNVSEDRPWYVRGAGRYELKLSLLGEIRTTESGRQRLRVLLPVDATSQVAVISDLQLTVPHVIGPDVTSNAAIRPVVTAEADSTTIFISGLQQDTQISWQVQETAGSTATVIRAVRPADMQLDLRTSPAALTCSQDIRIDGGTIRRIDVRLPGGYADVQITGYDANGDSIVRPGDVQVDASLTSATIPFREPVRGDVTLKFNLGIPVSADSRTLTVAVPDLSRVDDESARVRILIPRGLAVDAVPGVLTRRISVDAPGDARYAVNAYSLISARSSLQLTVSEIDAYFGVEPHLTISTDGQALRMLAQFPVNVSRGSLDDVLIRWPQYQESGWQIQRGSTRLLTDEGEQQVLTADDSDPNEIHVDLRGRQPGQFIVEFEAFCSSVQDTDGICEFHLPDIPASTQHSTTVTLLESDDYSLRLTRPDGQSPFLMIPPRRLNASGEQDRVTSWLVNESGSRVRLQQTRQTQEISAAAVFLLEPASVPDSIHVSARFDISVRHRDLTELRLTIPDDVVPTVRPVGSPVPLTQGRTAGTETVWALPEGARRRLTVQVDYQWTPQNETDVQMLPLVLPSQGLQSIRIGTQDPHLLRVAADADWRQVFSEEFAAAWQVSEFRPGVAIDVSGLIRRRQDSHPDVILVRSEVSEEAVISTTTAMYSQVPRHVLFRAAAGTVVRSVLVDGFQVDSADFDRIPLDGGRSELWRIRIGPVANGSVVRVSVTSQTDRQPHHHLVSIADIDRPVLFEAPPWLTAVWIVCADRDLNLTPLNDPPSTFYRWLRTSDRLTGNGRSVRDAARSAVAGLPDDVRSAFWKEFESPIVETAPALLCMTSAETGRLRVLTSARTAGWLAAAALGLLLYVVFLWTQPRFVTALITVALTILALVFVVPPRFSGLLLPGLPAAALSLTAWGLRRQDRRRRRYRRSDAGGSIFVPAHRREATDPSSSESASSAEGAADRVSSAAAVSESAV